MAAFPARFADGLANLFSRLGTGADRATQSFYYAHNIDQGQLEAAYRSSWLTRKVHDLVPFEMTRAGRNWQAEKDQIETLENAERDLQLWRKLREALTVARLHGGAAIVLGVRQGMPDQPLRVAALGKDTLRYAVVFSRHQLSAPMGIDRDPESDFFGQPLMWEIRAPKGNAIRIHPSRVITFHGSPLPQGSLALSELERFWGDPLLVSLKSAIDNAETVQAAVATLLHEMKQDVISIPGLTEKIATEGAEGLLAARLEAAQQFRSMFNTLLLDGGKGGQAAEGGETWETRQMSFAEYPELLTSFLGIVAGASDIPVTRLLGQSPGGLQSTGKGEQDDFNRMIAAKQDADLAPGLMGRLDEILIRSALGRRPPEVYSEFAPLDELDAGQASEIEKREAETVQIYVNTGAIPADALAKGVQNRLLENGRWPGLDAALDAAEREAKLLEEPDEPEPGELPEPANDDQVEAMQRRGAITRDQALTLLADASPRSLYVYRKLENAGEFLAWAKAQGFDMTVDADDLHVTIVYSRRPVDWMKAGDDWNGGTDGKYTVAPGGPRVVEKLGAEGAVVLFFSSSTLAWRHESILRQAEGSHDFAEYQPHVTITYDVPAGFDLAAVEPYRGALEFGPEIFEEIKPRAGGV
jgi:phage-related protein (TIGR01555 family)